MPPFYDGTDAREVNTVNGLRYIKPHPDCIKGWDLTKLTYVKDSVPIVLDINSELSTIAEQIAATSDSVWFNPPTPGINAAAEIGNVLGFRELRYADAKDYGIPHPTTKHMSWNYEPAKEDVFLHQPQFIVDRWSPSQKKVHRELMMRGIGSFFKPFGSFVKNLWGKKSVRKIVSKAAAYAVKYATGIPLSVQGQIVNAAKDGTLPALPQTYDISNIAAATGYTTADNWNASSSDNTELYDLVINLPDTEGIFQISMTWYGRMQPVFPDADLPGGSAGRS